MPPAARITDKQSCPAVSPGPTSVPHIGGPIAGPGISNVLIGGLPAAVLGDSCTCAGPPATITTGSNTVMIGGKPAARLGDKTDHSGAITFGIPTVLIGG